MTFNLHKVAWFVALGGSIIAGGCSSGSSGIAAPKIDATAAAQQALELYDADHDGQLSAAELAKSPALASAMRRIDANGDQRLSAEEIANRIRSWSAHGTILKAFQCRVLVNGQPLSGAEVVLEPEQFLNSSLSAAKGETNAQGIAIISIPRESLSDRAPSGTYLGLYTVRITSPANGRSIPARYNQSSELGQEVADDSLPIDTSVVDFQLTTS